MLKSSHMKGGGREGAGERGREGRRERDGAEGEEGEEEAGKEGGVNTVLYNPYYQFIL